MSLHWFKLARSVVEPMQVRCKPEEDTTTPQRGYEETLTESVEHANKMDTQPYLTHSNRSYLKLKNRKAASQYEKRPFICDIILFLNNHTSSNSFIGSLIDQNNTTSNTVTIV